MRILGPLHDRPPSAGREGLHHVVLVEAENWELLTIRQDEQEAHLAGQLHLQRPASPGE